MSDLDPFQSDEWKDAASGDLEARQNKKPLAILGIAALAAILMMSFGIFKKSVVYYNYPSEVMASPVAFEGKVVRLQGTVVPGTIQYDDATGATTFEVLDPQDETTTMTVVYSGTVPDTLKDNAQAVAEGEYKDGEFQATTLFAKCPSKFSASTSPAAAASTTSETPGG
jgi:cytochrome c-type biogenesis protein CcmE